MEEPGLRHGGPMFIPRLSALGLQQVLIDGAGWDARESRHAGCPVEKAKPQETA